MNSIWIQEIDAPSGVEPLCWRLLTSEPIQTAEQAASVVWYYALRWRIKAYYKTWKSGAGVERQRMQHSENLKRMITVTAFVAVRLLHLREALQPRADDHADRCDAVLEKMNGGFYGKPVSREAYRNSHRR